MNKHKQEQVNHNKQITKKEGVLTMNKKHSTIVKMITGTALAVVMMLSLAMPAYADDYSSGTNASQPAEAAITKVFNMPVNTNTPAAAFDFVFTPQGVNESTDISNMPKIPNKTISFSPGEDPTRPNGTTIINNGVKSVVKESDNILSGFTSTTWAQAGGTGVYKYKVQEVQSGVTISDPAKAGAEYSKAIYDLEIWVDKDENGQFYAKYIAAKIVPGSVDEYFSGTPGSAKVDPTPGKIVTKPGTPTIADHFSQLIFTNKYWKTEGGGSTDPSKSTLEIVKKIHGNGAVLTTYFDITITVTTPAFIPNPQPYKAYVMNKTGTIVTDTSNEAKNGVISGTDTNGGYFLFTSDTAKVIKLTHEQRLVFVDLHAGSIVKAQEAASPDYIPSYSHTFNGSSKSFTGTVNKPFGFPRDPEDKGPHYTLDGLGKNIVTFSNERTGATPTGVSVDDLPYIILIGIAAAGFAGLIGFIIIKASKSRKNSSKS